LGRGQKDISLAGTTHLVRIEIAILTPHNLWPNQIATSARPAFFFFDLYFCFLLFDLQSWFRFPLFENYPQNSRLAADKSGGMTFRGDFHLPLFCRPLNFRRAE